MARSEDEPSPKPVRWVGSSRDDLSGMLKNPVWPRLLKKVQMQGGGRCEVRGVLGPYAAVPREPANAAGGPFSAACYVLQAFQKQSKRGIATPRQEIVLIGQRLQRAKEDYERWQSEQRGTRPGSR